MDSEKGGKGESLGGSRLTESLEFPDWSFREAEASGTDGTWEGTSLRGHGITSGADMLDTVIQSVPGLFDIGFLIAAMGTTFASPAFGAQAAHGTTEFLLGLVRL